MLEQIGFLVVLAAVLFFINIVMETFEDIFPRTAEVIAKVLIFLLILIVGPFAILQIATIILHLIGLSSVATFVWDFIFSIPDHLF